MPKFLVQGSYTDQGLKGILKEGGSERRARRSSKRRRTGGRGRFGLATAASVRTQQLRHFISAARVCY